MIAVGLGLAGQVDAQTPPATPTVSATITADPSAVFPGSTVQVTAVFTPSGTLPNYDVSITLTSTDGQGTIAATAVSTTSGLSGCSLDVSLRSFGCNWDSALDTPQTLVVTVNVGPGATPVNDPLIWRLDANAGPDGGFRSSLAQTNIVILDPATTTSTTTTTLAPTTTAPTTAPPTTAAPTTAVPTTAAGASATLPSTGASGAATTSMAVMAGLLVLCGASLLMVRRRA